VSLQRAARAVTAHIERLKAIHRSNEAPRHGDIEELFDLSERLALELKLSVPGLPCTLPTCTQPSADVVGGQPYCLKHARAMRELMTVVTAETPEIARTRLVAMEQGRAPWPAAIAAAIGG
jgi:hypothetical protein